MAALLKLLRSGFVFLTIAQAGGDTKLTSVLEDPAPSKAAPLASGPAGLSTVPSASEDPLESLNGAQIQELLQWLVQHAVDPAALSQEGLNRAALRGLLLAARSGAEILANPKNASPPAPHPALHARLQATAAYARVSSLTVENTAALRDFLTSLPPEVNTLLLDLRAPQPPGPLAGAATLASLFLPDQTPLYQILAPPAPPAPQLATGPPVWPHRLWLLMDEGTPAPAALAAHLLIRHGQALAFGSPPVVSLAETIDRPLGPAHLLRLPSATVSWPDGTRLTGLPLLPQIHIPARAESRRALLALTNPEALPAHLIESDHPRPNEASLMAGTPPELLTAPTTLTARPFPDPVLQQATDLLQNAAFLKLDAPEEIKRAQPGR